MVSSYEDDAQAVEAARQMIEGMEAGAMLQFTPGRPGRGDRFALLNCSRRVDGHKRLVTLQTAQGLQTSEILALLDGYSREGGRLVRSGGLWMQRADLNPPDRLKPEGSAVAEYHARQIDLQRMEQRERNHSPRRRFGYLPTEGGAW